MRTQIETIEGKEYKVAVDFEPVEVKKLYKIKMKNQISTKTYTEEELLAKDNLFKTIKSFGIEVEIIEVGTIDQIKIKKTFDYKHWLETGKLKPYIKH